MIRATSCEACVFAKWNHNKDLQVGCFLDRLDKLQDHGARVITVDNEERTYYEIHNRVCNTCRDGEWGKNRRLNDLIESVSREVCIRADILVFVDLISELEDIKNTVVSATNQLVSPASISIVLEYGYEKSSIEEILDFLTDSVKIIPWHVKELTFDEALPIDEALTSCNGDFYCVFHAGSEIAEDYLSRINDFLNKDMMRFVAIKPDKSDNGMFIQRKLHDALRGNKDGPILNKICWIANDRQQNFMVKDHD